MSNPVIYGRERPTKIIVNNNGTKGPMPKLFLASSSKTNTYKKRVVKHTTNFIIDYHNKFNFEKHHKVSPSIALEIKYTQQNI